MSKRPTSADGAAPKKRRPNSTTSSDGRTDDDNSQNTSSPAAASLGGTGGGHGLGRLTGIGAVQHAFHFLDGPADVLRASTASRRWRQLATGDVVWRPKAVREGMVEKAGVFEVALPAAADGAAAEDEDEEEEDKGLAGVGLAFYAEVFVLKVWLA